MCVYVYIYIYIYICYDARGSTDKIRKGWKEGGGRGGRTRERERKRKAQFLFIVFLVCLAKLYPTSVAGGLTFARAFARSQPR